MQPRQLTPADQKEIPDDPTACPAIKLGGGGWQRLLMLREWLGIAWLGVTNCLTIES